MIALVVYFRIMFHCGCSLHLNLSALTLHVLLYLRLFDSVVPDTSLRVGHAPACIELQLAQFAVDLMETSRGFTQIINVTHETFQRDLVFQNSAEG